MYKIFLDGQKILLFRGKHCCYDLVFHQYSNYYCVCTCVHVAIIIIMIVILKINYTDFA